MAGLLIDEQGPAGIARRRGQEEGRLEDEDHSTHGHRPMEGRGRLSVRGSWIRYNRESHRDKAVAWLSPVAFVVLWQVRAVAADEGDPDPDHPEDAAVPARFLDPVEVALELGRSDDYHPDRVREAMAELEAAGLITPTGSPCTSYRVRNVVLYNARRFKAREGRSAGCMVGQHAPGHAPPGTSAPKSGTSSPRSGATTPRPHPKTAVASRARSTVAGAGAGEGQQQRAAPPEGGASAHAQPSAEALALAELLARVVSTRAKSPSGVRGLREKRTAWASTFDAMLRHGAVTDPRDKDAPVHRGPIPEPEIRAALLWLLDKAPTSPDGFCWGGVIRSPTALRRKWGKIARSMDEYATPAPSKPTRESPLARRDVTDFGRGAPEGAVSCPVLRFASGGLSPTRLVGEWQSWAAERRRRDAAWMPSTDPDLIAIVTNPKWSGTFTLAQLDADVEAMFSPEEP